MRRRSAARRQLLRVAECRRSSLLAFHGPGRVKPVTGASGDEPVSTHDNDLAVRVLHSELYGCPCFQPIAASSTCKAHLHKSFKVGTLV